MTLNPKEVPARPDSRLWIKSSIVSIFRQIFA